MRTSAAISLVSSRRRIAATCRGTSSTHLLVASTVVHVGVNAGVNLVGNVGIVGTSIGASSIVVVASHASASHTSAGCGSVLTGGGTIRGYKFVSVYNIKM